MLDANESDLGGYKSVTVAVKAKGTPEPGEAPYALLKFEGGVHRVQRVPVTESPGPRAHLRRRRAGDARGRAGRRRRSTTKDLRIDVFRSSGPGGQSVEHHRLRGPDHPPARPASWPAARTRSPSCRTASRRCASCGPGCSPPPRKQADAEASDARRSPGPHGRPLRADPHLQLPGEPDLRPPHRLQGLQPRPGARRRPRRRDRSPASRPTWPPGWTPTRDVSRRGRLARRCRRRRRPARPRPASPSPEYDAAELLAHVLGATAGPAVAASTRSADATRTVTTPCVARRAAPGAAAAPDRPRRLPLRRARRSGPGSSCPGPRPSCSPAGRSSGARSPRRTRRSSSTCAPAPARSRCAVADEVPGGRVHAVELDADAHAWAARNLAGTGVDLRAAATWPTRLRRARRHRRRRGLQPALHPARRLGVRRPRGPRPRPAPRPVVAATDGLDAMRVLERAARPGCCGPAAWSASSTPTPRASRAPAVFAGDGRWTEVRDHRDLAGRAALR